MKKRLYIFVVVVLVAVCAGVQCLLDERREPLFTFEEHRRNFVSHFSVGLLIASIGLLVSLAKKRGG